MHEFCWWVSDLDDTPIHYLYRKIVEIVYGLEQSFFTRLADIEKIEMIISERFF